jgi:alkanesulfonate monooxygenase SsuD/methylene tetrahydromethanopterin reductase-like flavin-dependent oxidoreductase (luciferase family)
MALQFGWWDHFEQRTDIPLAQQYDERIQLIQRAEAYGFYGYHIAEHHFTTLDMAPSPLVFLAAVARHTSTIRLGTMVLCLPLYHPTRLLQEFCMLDQLSRGRFMPGVGRGVRDVEHEWFGSDVHASREVYEEVLAILRQGIAHGRLTHRGPRYQYDDVPINFTMHQGRQPRFWYAGNLQRAAEQGMHAFGRGARDQVEQYWKIWEAGRARHDPRFLGDDPMVGSTRHLVVADTDAEAIALARRAFRAYAEHFHATETRIEGGQPGFGGLPRPGGANFDDMLQSNVVMAGSAATLRDKLRRFLDAAGPRHNYLVGAFQWGDLSHEEAGHSLDLFAAEVMPALG